MDPVSRRPHPMPSELVASRFTARSLYTVCTSIVKYGKSHKHTYTGTCSEEERFWYSLSYLRLVPRLRISLCFSFKFLSLRSLHGKLRDPENILLKIYESHPTLEWWPGTCTQDPTLSYKRPNYIFSHCRVWIISKLKRCSWTHL